MGPHLPGGTPGPELMIRRWFESTPAHFQEPLSRWFAKRLLRQPGGFGSRGGRPDWAHNPGTWRATYPSG